MHSDHKTSEPLALKCSQIDKAFGEKKALSSASISVAHSSIHALVGENGAGKSTLINIVSGLLLPDRGTVEVSGKAVQFRSALDAVAAGIGMVHQHFLLAEALTVAENVWLGQRSSAAGWKFDRRQAELQVATLAEQTGLAVDPRTRIADLPVGMRQRVEIIKALSRGAKILLLDEPTAVLAPPEIETLFENLRTMRANGRTIVIVSHKLHEIFSIASDVTVLRSGETVFEGSLTGLTERDLAEKMIGRELPRINAPAPLSLKEATPVLDLSNIRVPGLLDVKNLSVKSGEIVGVCGVEGNGQNELAGVIAGTLSPDESEPKPQTRFASQNMSNSIKARVDAGLAYIPADRHREGLVLEMTLSENLHLRKPLTRSVGIANLLDADAMKEHSDELLQKFGVVPPDSSLPAQALSGGNQQKVVLARELHSSPKLILACNPTRGLDVGAASDVHKRLIAASREQNAGVLLISTDLDEVLALADRVLVLYRGKLLEAGPRGVSKAEVGLAMVGAKGAA